VITPTVLEYENTQLEVSYTYTAKNKNKRYKEQEIVEFKDYSGFLVYISAMMRKYFISVWEDRCNLLPPAVID
ncbi:MAG: hypothetical protein IKW68_03095, partial [Clostridia bacterium]|nr:hypothetical protein [Clostridia bacterium]